MKRKALVRRPVTWTAANYFWSLLLMVGLLGISACASKPITQAVPQTVEPSMQPEATPSPMASSTDPRVGLGAGLYDAEEAAWNLGLCNRFGGGLQTLL